MIYVSILRANYYSRVKEGLKAHESKNGSATPLKRIWKLFAVRYSRFGRICSPNAAKEAER
jgi:hypothetical protein